MGILLHEIIKLMYHAKVKDPVFFRIGTCGGVGVEGGTVVISEEAVDEMLNPYYEQVRNHRVLRMYLYAQTIISNASRGSFDYSARANKGPLSMFKRGDALSRRSSGRRRRV